ncbi:MAG: hypothetical protein CVV47_00400 [Spirochaetae bacterium HGW-Spirochaetae-3]|nr:MAG: hypothetical protein CVV47_00400 [Spirochaetae bacterium HGW-Spirochaetae-3]
MRIRAIATATLLFLSAALTIAAAQESQATAAVTAEGPAVPRSFRGIELGMPMDEVKAILTSDGIFAYRGEPDVSLLPRPDESLIEVSGLSFIRRAFFQFYEGKLFVMIFALNEKQMDHYSVFTSLSSKYGKPDALSPSESVWEDAATRMSVERPLAVKYIDMAVFDALKAKGVAEQSYEEILRADFLGGF